MGEEGSFLTKQQWLVKLRSTEDGLTSSKANQKLKEFGENKLFQFKPIPIYVLFFKELTALFPLLLLLSSGLSLFAHLQTPNEGYGIIAGALLFVVLLNAGVSLFQKRKVQQIMQSFQAYIPERVVVNRDGQKAQLNASLLVPGDVVFLQEGDKIPADGIIIRCQQLNVDESILTGESGSVVKRDYNQSDLGMLYSGSTIVSGHALLLITATGNNTKFGKISRLTQSVHHTLTPMEKEINIFVKRISIIAVIIGVTFFLVSMFYLGNPFWTNLIFAIGIIVANVPEGLLPTVTLSLTQASRKMAKKNAVVKTLESVETLGSCTVICTDKTGTLTQNNMTVSEVFVNGTLIDTQQKNWEPSWKENPASHVAEEIMILCNEAMPITDDGVPRFVGDPTETALYVYCDKFDSVSSIQSRFSLCFEKPFNSDDKYMVKLYRTEGNTFYATIKGASEVIINQCSGQHLNGMVTSLDQSRRAALVAQAKQMQTKGLRVLALAYKATASEEFSFDNCVFVGLVGLLDPPRPEVKAAVAKCKAAGVRPIIISGDNPETVAAIARMTGIAENPFVVTGPELLNITDDVLADIVKRPELIFARTSPEQKLRIVAALQQQGEIVAVTGDGVNDAPALKKADIGVAMGKSGTDVAKDASDIILLDDNFATIVSAIEEGRTVFDNIKKFITYILTSNIPEIIPFLLYIIFYPAIPLAITVIQILSIDLITDIIPAIGLGNEPAEKDVMTRSPRKKTERLVSANTFYRSYGFIGVIESFIAYVVFFAVLRHGGWQWWTPVVDNSLYMSATGAFLAAIIACQIGNVMACRTVRQPALAKLKEKNTWIILGICIEVVFIIAITTVPYVDKVMHTGTIPWPVWILLGLAPIGVFVLEELRKIIVMVYTKRFVEE